MERFGPPSIMSYIIEIIFLFKQQSNDGLFMLGKDLEGLLMNENMALDIG
jgi:hypothetical protein